MSTIVNCVSRQHPVCFILLTLRQVDHVGMFPCHRGRLRPLNASNGLDCFGMSLIRCSCFPSFEDQRSRQKFKAGLSGSCWQLVY